LALAAAAHRLIENPVRFSRFLVSRPVLTLGGLAFLTVLSFGAAQISLRSATSLAAEPILASISKAVNDRSAYPGENCFTLSADPVVKSCTFGDPAASTTIALFGDSHAAQWFSTFRRITTERNWRLVTFLKSGCPATDVVYVHPTL